MNNKNLEIIIINLERDKKKRNYISKIMNSLNCNYSFFDAITPCNIPENYRKIFYDSNGSPWGNLLPGEIGCCASHIKIMDLLIKGELPDPIVIMEDDAFPTEKSIYYMKKIYDIMICRKQYINYVNMYQHGPKSEIDNIKIDRKIKLIRNYIPSYRTHCYMINRSVCKKFLENIDKITMPLDLEIIFSAITGKMHVWEVSKTIVGINPEFISESSIAPDTQERSVDRDEKFKYAYRRKIARQRYGMIHDMRYQISRKIWKLSRSSKP